MSGQRPSSGGGWLSAILVPIVVIGLMLAILGPQAKACHRRGGVFLWREGQCVAAPPPVMR